MQKVAELPRSYGTFIFLDFNGARNLESNCVLFAVKEKVKIEWMGGGGDRDLHYPERKSAADEAH